jgi:predicted PurR-regulated permease PerM
MYMPYFNFETSTKVILKVILALLTLAFLWVVRDVVVILLFSVVLASAMEPLVCYLHARKIPRSVSVLAVYVLVFAVVGGIVSLLIPPVISQVQTLQNTLPDLVANLQSRLPVSISQQQQSSLSCT